MPLPFRNTEQPRSAPYLATVVVLPIPDIVPTTVVVEPDAAAGVVVVATDVVGTVPVMGVWSFFELEQPATTAALRARAAMNTLIPREVMV
jgi:hypothetical protein